MLNWTTTLVTFEENRKASENEICKQKYSVVQHFLDKICVVSSFRTGSEYEIVSNSTQAVSFTVCVSFTRWYQRILRLWMILMVSEMLARCREPVMKSPRIL